MFRLIKFLLSILLVFSLIKPLYPKAEDISSRYVEIFDPKQDKVVKVVTMNEGIKALAEQWLHSIEEMYDKNDPATDDGYAVKIPFDKPVKMNSKWIKAAVNEVFVLIPESKPPVLLVFETESRLLCFPLKGNINSLSKMLGFVLEKANTKGK